MSNESSSAFDSSVSPTLEEKLRVELRTAQEALKRREPHESTYWHLLKNSKLAPAPRLAKRNMYSVVGSDLRARVERFMAATVGKDPFDRLAQRKRPEESALRAALTLREHKDFEQKPLLEATLASFPRRHGMDHLQRRKYLDSIARGLKSPSSKWVARSQTLALSAAEQTERARMQAALDRQKAQARSIEQKRQQREDDDRKEREQELERKRKQRLPEQRVFEVLWEMEFSYLGGTNPFRMIIDRNNCASVGAPDYFDVIDKPMNLTWIKQKVESGKYESFAAFAMDVELMLMNAIRYNSDASNPYRIAAEEMKKRYIKMKKVLLRQQKQKG